MKISITGVTGLVGSHLVKLLSSPNSDGSKNDIKALIREDSIVDHLKTYEDVDYVIGGLEKCNSNKILTACITCNEGSPLASVSQFPIEVVVGPEFVTGSTRMKAGTAQKLVLNMISTSLMIKLGRVKGNRMVDMQLSNDKLVDRGTLMVAEETGLEYDSAKELLEQTGSVRAALNKFNNG